MKIDLDKKALISLVCGESPDYGLFENKTVKTCGRYSDNRGWQWADHELEKLNEQQLYDLYKLCRESWD